MRNFAALRASPSWHGLLAAVTRISVSARPSRQGRIVTESVRGKAFATSASLSNRLTIRVPEMAESISEGTIVAFQRNVNDIVDANDELATIETDKVDVTVESPERGCVIQFLVAEGETVVVGQEFAVIETKPNRGSSTRAEDEIAQNQSPLDRVYPDMDQPVAQDRKVQPQSSPSLPEQAELMPSDQPDVQVRSPQTTLHRASPAPKQDISQPSKVDNRSHKETAVPMPRMRLTIAKRLKDSQDRTASLTAIQQVDMSALMHFRKLYKDSVLERHGVRLGYMGAFIRAATTAALEIPEVNASMDVERSCITYRDYVDVSVAVSTPKGLVTPTLRNCESKDIIRIEEDVAKYAKKAREGRLTMDDINGGNFTISNPGIFGSLFGTPVINYPQSAVFNMNSIRDEPVVINGQIVIRPVMYITITYDHRLIDGREAAQFLNTVKSNIEDPSRMLLSSSR